MIREIASLPIHDVLPALCKVLASSQTALLSAPPGSGKTTAAPLVLLQQPWLQGQTILMLEPRRLAVRASAARMAELLGEKVGQTVGYRVRFDSQISKQTRIEVVTEGILTRRLQQDPELKGVGLVIFDEFHERNLHADLGLALCLDIIQGLRDDLRLLVMSATLDTAAVSALLGDAPIVSGGGRSFPVEIQYLDEAPKKRMAEAAAKAVKQAVSEQQGDILLFLPGVGEIRRVNDLLCNSLPAVEVCPLYGDLSQAAQDRAIRPHPQGLRRVVLATAIAETSLTIEGITTVVDAGWSRRPKFDPNTGLTRLETVRVSRAAADQRAGRAGRLAPGFCYRLWSSSTALQAHTSPEIMDADMALLALELAQWGIADPAQLSWLDSPPAGAYAQAQDLLKWLAALDEQGRITAAGRRMTTVAAHPRLAHMLLQAEAMGQGALAADLAALLSERDLIPRTLGQIKQVDIEQRLQLLDCWRKQGAKAVMRVGGDANACKRVEQVSRQYRQSLKSNSRSISTNLSIGALLANAYPDRIAQLRAASNSSYLLSSGRGAALPEGDALSGCGYLVAAQLDAGTSEGRIFLAAPVALSELRAEQKSHIKTASIVQWDSREKAVTCRTEERFDALILASRPIKSADPDLTCSAMLAGIKQMGIESLPWSDALRSWQARVLSLRHWQPEKEWPDVSDQALTETMDEWLPPWLAGISRASHLQRLDLQAILSSTLKWEKQQALKQGAPTSIQVPSGSQKRLIYQPGEPPVLAVRLQEMFGLADTPRVCWGEVQVVLHLLSPAQRPIQVTQDLRGFWERTYAEVKKELKGRYPKHYWPDDPWNAKPTARAKPRRT